MQVNGHPKNHEDDVKTAKSQFDKDIEAHPTLSFILLGFGPILWLVGCTMSFAKENYVFGTFLLVFVPIAVVMWLNRNRIRAYFCKTDHTKCSSEYLYMAEEIATIYYIVKKSRFIEKPSDAEILFATSLIYFRDVKENNNVSDEKIVFLISKSREKHPTEKNQNLRTLIKKIEQIVSAHNSEITNECINKNDNKMAQIVSQTIMNGENGALYSFFHNVISSSLKKEEFRKKVSSYYSLEAKYNRINHPQQKTVVKTSLANAFEQCVSSCLISMKGYADTDFLQTKIAICSACYVICDYSFFCSGGNRFEKSTGLIDFILDSIIPKSKRHEFDSLVNLYGRAIRGLVDVKNSWSILDCNMDNAITVVFCVLGDILFDEDNYYDYDSTPLELYGFEYKLRWSEHYVNTVLPTFVEFISKI